MKGQINEIARMQQIAGIIKENEMQGANWDALEMAIKNTIEAEGGSPKVIEDIKHIVDIIAAGGSINDPELAEA